MDAFDSQGEIKGRPGKAMAPPDAQDIRWELRNPASSSQWHWLKDPCIGKAGYFKLFQTAYEARS
jgi:hypothetical protein